MKPAKIEVDGVGIVEVDDSFFNLPEDQQQATIAEIKAASPPAPAAPKPQAPAPSAPQAPRGTGQTYGPLQQFVQSRYPNARITSTIRDQAQNAAANGVPNSYHLSGQAVDVVGLSEAERNRLYTDLKNAGVNPREFKFHDAGSGLHLHIAADQLPEGFGAPPAQNGQSKGGYVESVEFPVDDVDPLAPLPEEESSVLDKVGIAAHGLGRGAVGAAGFIADGIENTLKGNIPGDVRFLYDQVTGQLDDQDKAHIDQRGTPQSSANLDGLYTGVFGEPDINTKGEEYVNSIAQGVGGALVPLPGAGALSTGVKVASGAAGGLGAQVGTDIAPDNPYAGLVGGLVGGLAGGAAAGGPKVVRNAADARFVGQQAKRNPFAAYDAEIAQDLTALVENKARSGLDPKGRAQVTAKEINAVESSYITGFVTKINAMPDVPPSVKRQLIDALEQRHSNLSPDDLDGLRGTVEGNAVADGILKVQRLRQLTPEIQRKSGFRKFLSTTLDAAGIVGGASAGGPLGAIGGIAGVRTIGRLLAGRGDAEAARVHSAERVIARNRAYKKLQDKVGPSGQRESQDALNAKYGSVVDAEEAAAAQAAKDAADRKAQAATDRKDKADAKTAKELLAKAKGEIKAEVARKTTGNMTPEELADYALRTRTARQKLNKEPTKAPRDDKVADKLSEANRLATKGRTALDKFDQELAKEPQAPKPDKAPKPKKLNAADQSAADNIKLGVQGPYNAYADSLGVTRADVLAALNKIAKDGVDPFEIDKLVNGYKLSPAGKTALIPRLRQQLTKDGVYKRIEGEAAASKAKQDAAKAAPKAKPEKVSPVAQAIAEKAAPTAAKTAKEFIRKAVGQDGDGVANLQRLVNENPDEVRAAIKVSKASGDPNETRWVEGLERLLEGKPYIDDSLNAKASPKASNVEAQVAPEPAPAPAPEAPPERGDFRNIRRKPQWEQGKERIVQAQERQRDAMWSDDSELSSEILAATQDDVEHIIRSERTAESALRYFDDVVAPRFRGLDATEIKRMRTYIERIAREKRYQTDAEFERGAKTSGKPGRPKKAREEYPDPATDPDYVPF